VSSDDASRIRLLTVCGSLQQRSSNRASLDAACARAAGAIIDDYDGLAEIPAFNVDLVETPGPAVEGWRDRIRRADAVLIAAPEYAGGVAGALKNALDWLVASGELYRKPVAVLTAATSGGLEARRTTVQTLSWQGAYVVGELGIAAPATKLDEDGRLTDPATAGAIGTVVDALVHAVFTTPADLVTSATTVVAAPGIDTAHVPPAA
jgi:NAD(P)H-dependent FMN reductase